MYEDIESALKIIEEDYITCFRMVRKIFDYLEKFGLKEFNKYSKYKWNYDRDKNKEYSYVCIRHGNSLAKKCLIKRRSYLDTADLYRWIDQKNLIQEALEEAYQYICEKVNEVKGKIENLKEIVGEYEEKLGDISKDYEETRQARKVLRDGEEVE